MNSPQTVFIDWLARLRGDQQCAERVQGPVEIILTGAEGGRWLIRGGPSPAIQGPGVESSWQGDATPSCTVTMDARDFVAVVQRELNPQIAFLSGRIQVIGEYEQALSLAPLLG